MKKKILLLTTIYPAPDLRFETAAIHFFTREWVKIGYEVKVVHCQAVYPIVFYLIAKLFREIIASRTGAVVYTKRDKKDKQYTMDNVTVHRLIIFKWIPHGKYTKKIIRDVLRKINLILTNDNWIPDILIGHFPNPQLEIIHELKKIYNSRTCMVMHWPGNDIKRIYKDKYQDFMNSIDIWGYRSIAIQRDFENIFGKQRRTFLCYSGIPEGNIAQKNDRKFEGDLKRFLYIGDLIKRKHPISLIYAIKNIYNNESEYHITYVGEGAEKTKIQGLVDALHIYNHISFLGHISRDEIPRILDDSDCMIMISRSEAFGLVYLEAMGRGCITIGSKNEGIDGIIQHGVNGFLCEAGNDQELADIIRYINSLSAEERKFISNNAIATANELTDSKAAIKYMESVDYIC